MDAHVGGSVCVFDGGLGLENGVSIDGDEVGGIVVCAVGSRTRDAGFESR